MKPRLQFRLRTLLVFVGILCALLTAISHLWVRQFQAVRKVEALGGHVWYDHQVTGRFWPALFGRVTGVNLGGFVLTDGGLDFFTTTATDDDVAVIVTALPHLKEVYLDSTQVTDGVVAVLSRCRTAPLSSASP